MRSHQLGIYHLDEDEEASIKSLFEYASASDSHLLPRERMIRLGAERRENVDQSASVAA